MKVTHLVAGLALLVVLASAQHAPVTESLTSLEGGVQARNLRSFHASATYTQGVPPVVVTLDPSVQAPNGLVITDAIINAEGGPFWYMVEIRENGITKATLGEATSPNWNSVVGSPTVSLRSGITIRTSSALEIAVSGGTYLSAVPQTIHCTLSGYVW